MSVRILTAAKTFQNAVCVVISVISVSYFRVDGKGRTVSIHLPFMKSHGWGNEHLKAATKIDANPQTTIKRPDACANL